VYGGVRWLYVANLDFYTEALQKYYKTIQKMQKNLENKVFY
jgi:hypothetical protein